MDTSRVKPPSNAFSRIIKYISVRAVTLALMLSVGIFLTIVVVNYGGYIDKIREASIDEALNFVSLSMRGATREEVAQVTEKLRWSMEEAYGLHKPFILRCIRWFYQTITFDWGSSRQIGVDRFLSSEPVPISKVVLGRLPYTLLLAGTTNLLLFFASIFLALSLAKNYGGFWDKLLVGLSPLSSIPNWVYGIILTVILAGELHLLPFNGMYDTFPPATKWGYIPIVAKHMILPVLSIFLGLFFSTVYTWRTFFLIHSGEDYLDLAQAKGLPNRIIERRYMLKPTLPYIITSFTILMITFWQGIIVLEVFFDWPGLGQLFMQSLGGKEMAVTIGIVVVFALLLGLSVFLLDIVYVLVDPRVKISGDSQTARPVTGEENGFWLFGALKDFWSSYNPRRIGALLVQGIQSLTRRSLASSLATNPSTRGGGAATVLPLNKLNRQAVLASCPYFQLEPTPGNAHGAVLESGRCVVHDHPERIGRVYQAQVCRTVAHHSCPRLSQAPSDSRVLLQGGPSSYTDKATRKRASRASEASSLYVSLHEFTRFPAAVIGVAIILALIGVSIYAVIAIPYKEAIYRWGPETVTKYLIPKNALPEWVNFFRKEKLPTTLSANSASATGEGMKVSKVTTPGTNGTFDSVITYTIDYPYDGFPQDMLILFSTQYEKKPFSILTWTTPDGREFKLGNFSVVSSQRYDANQDMPKKYITGKGVFQKNFFSGTGGMPVTWILFEPENGDLTSTALKGTYTLRIDSTLFDQNSNVDAEVILYGQVYGLAGTDDLRRDIMVALLWGTPIALAFGLLGAVTTGVLSMVIAAIGVWFGGWVDTVIQRLTEVNMILPTLPIAITIYYLYSKSIWMILGILILLSIFGSSIKTYRAAFMQVKELPYIEAARTYGASDWRIIRHYLVPRIVPLLIPQLVILVPSYVFFEATLAYLQVSDPYLPTWGKVIFDALTRGTYQGYYYWVLEPVILMIVTALAFAIVGFALDSILNPRLRHV